MPWFTCVSQGPIRMMPQPGHFTSLSLCCLDLSPPPASDQVSAISLLDSVLRFPGGERERLCFPSAPALALFLGSLCFWSLKWQRCHRHSLQPLTEKGVYSRPLRPRAAAICSSVSWSPWLSASWALIFTSLSSKNISLQPLFRRGGARKWEGWEKKGVPSKRREVVARGQSWSPEDALWRWGRRNSAESLLFHVKFLSELCYSKILPPFLKQGFSKVCYLHLLGRRAEVRGPCLTCSQVVWWEEIALTLEGTSGAWVTSISGETRSWGL